MAISAATLGFKSRVCQLFFIISFAWPAKAAGARLVAIAASRGRGAARAQPARAVARPLRGVGGCGWPGRGMAGRGWAAAWHDRLGFGRCGRSWPVAKSSTKVLNAKEKHKFVCSVVVGVI
jgi:hypothetical protein